MPNNGPPKRVRRPTTRPVIVTVEPRSILVTEYAVHCTVCGSRLPHYLDRRRAEQWAEHHRRLIHPDVYPPKASRGR